MRGVNWLAANIGWVLFALYALVVLKWLWGHVELSRFARAATLRPAADAEPVPPPRVSVIIPVHNEAAGVAACLERVLSQRGADLQVVVANDRSTDATGAIVGEIAGRHPNVRCVDIAELPPGWLGKTHALAVATQHADGEYLLFTDGDVVWSPNTLETVLAFVREQRIDFLSLWPKTIVRGFWEGLLIPACGWVLSLWFHARRPERIEDTPAFANGQFLLIRREAYERIGGHAAVPDEMAEDVALAARAARAGLRRYLGVGRELLATRMYENLPQIIAGWTRVFIGALGARWKLLMSIVLAVVGVWSAVAATAAGLMQLGHTPDGGPGAWLWLSAAAVHFFTMYTVLWRHLALGIEGRTYLLLFPLAVLGAVVLLVYCLLLIHGVGTIAWGGMRFRVVGSRAVSARAGR